MNPDPDYSAAYVILRTDAPRRARGPRLRVHHRPRQRGPGRGHRRAGGRCVVGLDARRDPRRHWAPSGGALTGDSQLRWLGPEKGVIHMATAAVVNAVWDLLAKREGKPLWQLLARHDPRADRRLVDFRYLTDALTPGRGARDAARARAPGRAERERALLRRRATRLHDVAGLARLRRRQAALGCCREAVADGFTHFKLKVGADLEDDVRRCAIAREAIGDAAQLMRRRQPALGRRRGDRLDRARSRRSTSRGSRSRPAPTTCSATPRSRARSRPIAVATGEHAQNRVMFKQLLQARARSTSARSTPAGSAGSTRTSRSCCWPPSSASPSARTPAASACASSSSTWRVRLRRGQRRARGPGDRVRRPPARALRRPVRGRATGATSRHGARASAPRCGAESLRAPRFPDGAVWPRDGGGEDDERPSTGLRAGSVTGGASGIGAGDRAAAAGARRARRRARPRHRRRRAAAASPLRRRRDRRRRGPRRRRGGGRAARRPRHRRQQRRHRRAGHGRGQRRRRVAPGVRRQRARHRPRRARRAAAPARVRARRDRQHLLDRRHRRAAAARALQRDQGRGAVADAGDGRRPRPRGHPRQLRQPRAPPTRRGCRGCSRPPTTPTPSAPRSRPASRSAGWSAPTRSPRRSPTWPSPASASTTGTALAVDGGMQGLRLRPGA